MPLRRGAPLRVISPPLRLVATVLRVTVTDN